jgi:hypothetical protein
VATVYHQWPAAAAALPAATFPQLVKAAGTNFPVPGYAFDAAADETFYFDFSAENYGSGNVTVEVWWYADTATSGVVRWSAAIAAITPDTDSTDIETKAFGTAATFDDTHLGTTGQRLHRAPIAVSSLDSLASRDDVRLRVQRVGSNGADTMTGDAIAVRVTASYSDT